MNVALVGYGKMGRMIERLAPECGVNVIARLDVGDDLAAAKGADAAIEFTHPQAAAANLIQLADLGVPVVCGTTGWFDQLGSVAEAVERNNTALVWSANYSIGVAVFSRLVSEAARMLASEPSYGAWGWEIHHDEKKDAPSGTLLRLVGRMQAAGYERPIDVASNRAGAHPGTHEIGFDSSADTITLRHAARSREGFARGALKAARWIHGKRGVHEFSDILFGR